MSQLTFPVIYFFLLFTLSEKQKTEPLTNPHNSHYSPKYTAAHIGVLLNVTAVCLQR